MTVASARLLWGISSGAEISITPGVQSGTTVLLKNLYVWNPSASPASAELLLLTSPFTTWSRAAHLELAASAVVSWSGWIALRAPDVFAIQTDAAGVHYWLFGSVLQGEAMNRPLPESRTSVVGELPTGLTGFA